jgi:hypothetical protein
MLKWDFPVCWQGCMLFLKNRAVYNDHQNCFGLAAANCPAYISPLLDKVPVFKLHRAAYTLIDTYQADL